MQELLIPFSDIPRDILKEFMFDREIVFYPDENELYLKNKDKFHKVSKGAGENISVSSDKIISLNDEISVKEMDVQNEDIQFYYNEYLGEISPSKQVLLIIDTSSNGGIGGNIQVIGNDIATTYHICLNDKGTYELVGASSFSTKDDIVKVSYHGQEYIAIKFVHGKSGSVYLQGFDTRNYNLSNLTYVDSELTIV